jgi:hypothetical protein
MARAERQSGQRRDRQIHNKQAAAGELLFRQPKPFIWTAKASDILEKVKRERAALNKRPSV